MHKLVYIGLDSDIGVYIGVCIYRGYIVIFLLYIMFHMFYMFIYITIYIRTHGTKMVYIKYKMDI